MILEFVGSLLVILVAAELFTNGVEWLGFRLGLGESAVGSLLAAVGTALPETLIPIVSILLVGGAEGHAVGVGAILGAPFMLSTLAIAMVGVSALAFRSRRRETRAGVETGVLFNGRALRQDLRFFLFSYGLAVAAALAGSDLLKTAVAALLIPIYVFYVYRVVAAGGEVAGEELDSLYFDVLPFLGTGHPFLISAQVLASLVAIVLGAHFFVDVISDVARNFGADPLVVSLLVAPVATELPEKMNSVIWIARGKDHLAMGNITGAMVFQSTFPVLVGVLFTSWTLEAHAAASAVLALLSGIALYLYSLRYRHPAPMVAMALVYAGYVAYVLTLA